MTSKSVDTEMEVETAIKSGGCVVLLLYASWCPFSAKFLPVFDRHARGDETEFLKFKVEDESRRWDKFSVLFTPTVVCFKKGRLSKRLDGLPGRGLTEKQLEEFLEKVR